MAMHADPAFYLRPVINLLKTHWPENRVVNIVCHGHSVPAGYFATPRVDSLNAFPHLLRVALAERFRLKVIEDAAQAHGALYSMDGQERKAGTLGQAGAFSFYPGKNLGGMGDGGAVVTDDPEGDRRMRSWRDHGQSEKYIYVSPRGWNMRLRPLK